MSADFWAGYLSGAVGIVIGNPLDIIKVRMQSQGGSTGVASGLTSVASLAKGTAAPILGYGALNALLFVSYNRAETTMNQMLSMDKNLYTIWAAGALGGLATWVVSTPTELVKCRAQLSSPSEPSWKIARQIWQSNGIRGLYLGGVVTALRDSIGYGFYFWSYELAMQRWDTYQPEPSPSDPLKILLCGGLAGIITWASVFPLDVIKTRVQTQQDAFTHRNQTLGARRLALEAWREDGIRVFFRGLTVCSVRAFFVNAVQWAVYEWTMRELGQGRTQIAASA
ncbi:mitochondrial carrier domain-containing protein [Stachybotrys elegans]|uniref:Mitochondrial carrier domain-containing protein n=1 Tax=Stachybotrys elegans TaxID=80388 RepID=A0A8K0SWL4_9HYPO|nr:mitochondrial carrier domain-containing protein [Stachybotrys elegans]